MEAILIWVIHNYFALTAAVLSYRLILFSMDVILKPHAAERKSIVNKTIPAFIIIPFMGIAVDPEEFWFYVACIATITMGSLFRIGFLYKNNMLSPKAVAVQLMLTLPLCYFGYHAWVYYELKGPIQLVLFILSGFGVFIAGIADAIGKVGIRAWFRGWMRGIMADTKPEDKI